jgi:hypothetical protein
MGIPLDQQVLKSVKKMGWIYRDWYYNPTKKIMGWLPRSGLVLLWEVPRSAGKAELHVGEE